MLILMRPDATTEQVESVAKKVKELGFTPHKMPGAQRIAVAITGNPGPVDPGHFAQLAGVAEAVSISKPWKLVSRETHPHETVVSLPGPGGTMSRLGGGGVGVVARAGAGGERGQTPAPGRAGQATRERVLR